MDFSSALRGDLDVIDNFMKSVTFARHQDCLHRLRNLTSEISLLQQIPRKPHRIGRQWDRNFASRMDQITCQMESWICAGSLHPPNILSISCATAIVRWSQPGFPTICRTKNQISVYSISLYYIDQTESVNVFFACWVRRVPQRIYDAYDAYDQYDALWLIMMYYDVYNRISMYYVHYTYYVISIN